MDQDRELQGQGLDQQGTANVSLRRSRRAQRLAAIAAMGITPIVALAWAGCADDDTGNAAGPAYVDPGGTHGAELTVTIKGRGRVTASMPGLDCPSDCFAKYIFTNATADGAASKVSLKATPTPGSKFGGWSFSTEPVGSRGRGPAHCNPVLRSGSDPGIDNTALEIELPYGETTGTAPEGNEGACSAFTKVPIVYNITATFTTDPPVNFDGGSDAGALDAVYNPAQPDALNREIGMTQNGRLFWHFRSSGQSFVAYGTSPSSSSAPQTPQVLSTLPDSTITLFEVDPYGVVYQTAASTIYVVRYSSTLVRTIPGISPSCNALAIDSSYNVYCRTTSTIVMWEYATTYSTPITLYTDVPNGTDLVVESSPGPIYFTDSSSILMLPTSEADGGAAAPTTLISSRVSPRGLESSSSYLWWLESTTSFYTSTSKSGSPIAMNTMLPFSSGYQFTASDPSSSSFWVASSSAIYRATNDGLGTAGSQLFRDDLQNIGGIAADSQYVYWTQLSDGIVRRADRSGF